VIKSRRMQLVELQVGRPLELLLYDLYLRQGLSVEAVANRLGCSLTTAHRWLHAAGIPVRPRGRPKVPAVANR